MLTPFIPKDHSPPTAQPLPVSRHILIDVRLIHAHKVAHVGRATALFGLLRRLSQPAELVGVLARVLGDASVFQGAENGIRAVIFGEVVFVILKLGALRVETVLGALECISGVGQGGGFGACDRAGGEDTVFDQNSPQVAQLLV